MAVEASEEKRPNSAAAGDAAADKEKALAPTTTGSDTDEPVAPEQAPQGGLLVWLKIFASASPTWIDVCLLITGVISAAAAGIPFPLMGIIFGELVDNMNDATCAAGGSELTSTSTSINGANDPFAYEASINSKVLQLVYIAIAAMVCIYVYVLSWSLFSQRLAQRLRGQYVQALLRQPPGFFDARSAASGEVSTRLQGDMTAVQAGTSEKVGVLIASTSFFIACYVVAFIKQAKLAGILVSLIPAFLLMAMSGGFFVTKYMAISATSQTAASNIAGEALQHVSVVQSFGMAGRLEKKFAEHVATARGAGVKKGVAAAVQAGMLYFIAYSANALAFWQGSRMVVDTIRGEGTETVGQIYTVVFLLVDACVCLGNIAPILPILGSASAAFSRLMADINAPSAIDGTSSEGVFLPVETTTGHIQLENVSFAYPSRPQQPVLQNVNLVLPAGKHTALVGLSGSGKSTIAALVARLQDPVSGTITLDGTDIKTLNVSHLRSFISLVQQEPSLLDRSILENIALGLVNSPKPEHQALKTAVEGGELAELAKKGKDAINDSNITNPAVKEVIRLVKEAAIQADAHNFISNLENGYGTFAGPKGSLVSGGQRQRVALARALIRDPRILLLDEATSALDSTSEKKIQIAVERAAEGRTVISIAHRLSTIRNADKIVVLEAGEVVEEGVYDELVAREDGKFYAMAKLQSLGGKDAAASAVAEVSEKRDVVVDEEEEEENSKALAASISSKDETDSEKAAKDKEAAEKEAGWGSVFIGLGRLVKPSFSWLLLAIFAAVIVGGTFSGSGLIFGFTVGALNPCENSPEDILDLGKFFGGLLFMLACIELLANFFAWSCFGLIAERLLYAIRVLSFRSLMEQGVEWHQSGGRNPTLLLDIITKDSAAIGGFSGSTIGTVFAIIVNFFVAIILSHIIQWKIAIVCLSVVPILLGAGFMQLRQLARYEERHAASYAKATGVAVEAVQSIKTVAALSLEKEVMGSYARLLKNTRDEMVRAAAYTNIWLAISNSMSFLIYAFAYWWGSQKIMSGEANQTQFFIIVVSMLVSAQLWGQMFTLAPEFSRARTAFSRIMNILALGSNNEIDSKRGPHGKPPSGPSDPEAIDTSSKPSSGSEPGMRITFKDVSFSYPSRPDQQTLHNVSFTISPGQFVGLVGPSGAGKSTIMSLVQNLYSPSSGSILLDNVDITSSTASLRDAIAIVPQDPALFDGTVRFNVSLGSKPGYEPTQEEIEQACKLANIHDVIMAMPDGYDTECGASASRLSGGQRQRLAIARALVRKPRLLLLDESTSALDAASEAALQEGLDTVSQGTTVLAITHRLHTVKKADVIFVVEGGEVVDRGTHEELMARRERYRVNAMQQMLQ
ncbi:P-loop containing nucleoside triphosphate hydrolase protein [Apiosordaria backusii]|uniref:P-loop containing nucleoside triphosphate hydrolase protein n=1 Tax=Apiosordaria backusii TaxID=314023 RepID=A0AA40ANC2_9PEZI|nr:P-loop containing nucleoside triphosphate hydrolase protein [Apiosordaria backusii]